MWLVPYEEARGKKPRPRRFVLFASMKQKSFFAKSPQDVLKVCARGLMDREVWVGGVIHVAYQVVVGVGSGCDNGR